MQLREQVLFVLDEGNRPMTAREIAMMIEGSDHEAVAQTLTKLTEEGTVAEIRSIVAENILYSTQGV